MPRALSDYARSLIRDPSCLRALGTPLLLWECPSEAPDEALLLRTEVKGAMVRPTRLEPLVFELRKGASATNAFSMGVTVGRTDNNDVVLPDNSVSRFHAYFQQDRKTGGWSLVDAESKNGTRAGPLPLTPNRPHRVADGARLRFGLVELVFLEPASLERHLGELIRAG